MKPTIEILTNLQRNSCKNHNEVFTRLFRYLLRPDIYYIAYEHLYANKGAGTKGINRSGSDTEMRAKSRKEEQSNNP